jgi:membrane-bound serine protease (ClpP class)
VFLVLALILAFVLPWPWNLFGSVISVVAFLGELGFWHRRMRGQPKVVGRQRLIGATGVALSACRPEGQARVDGETWTVRCETGVDAGESVTVVDIDKLTLIVQPTSTPARPDYSTA